MEEKKINEMIDEKLDEVAGGGDHGFAIPEKGYSQTSLSGVWKCRNCEYIGLPKYVNGKMCCAKCGEPL